MVSPISADGRYVVVGIVPGGAEYDTEFHVIVTATGRETGDVILRSGGNEVAWLPGNRGFVYARPQDLPAGAPATAKRAKGAQLRAPAGDRPAHRSRRVRLWCGAVDRRRFDLQRRIRIGPGSRYALGVIGNGASRDGEWYITPIDSFGTSHPAWRKVDGFADQVTTATLHGDDLYLLTSHERVALQDPAHSTRGVPISPRPKWWCRRAQRSSTI